MPAERRDLILFLGVSITLLAAALVFSLRGQGGDSGVGRHQSGARPRTPVANASATAIQGPTPPASTEPSAVKTTADVFLPAYLRYEVGDLSPGVAHALRASAMPEFADALLAAPPRPTAAGGLPAAASLRGYRVSITPGAPLWAEVSGTARRGLSTERVSFVFENRGGRWLASGVGE
jgi:hypothetical protein